MSTSKPSQAVHTLSSPNKHLQRAVQRWCAAAPESDARARAGRQVAQALSDPHDLSQAAMLPADHPLVCHAVIVSDALEAATNGMTNPDAWEALNSLPPWSPLLPWKQLVLSLDRFYQRDLQGFHRESGPIPPDTPPARILPFLEGLLRGEPPADFKTVAERRLAAELVTEDPVVPSAVEELEAAAELEEYALFSDTAALLARHLSSTAPDLAASLALWAFRRLLDAEADTGALRSYCRGIFGPVECLRLVALATIRDEPEISLLYWIRYIREGVARRQPAQEETDAALAIACDLADAVEPARSDDPEDLLYHEALTADVRQLTGVLAEAVPARRAAAERADCPYAALRALAGRVPKSGAPGQRKSPRRRRRRRETEAGQLELFPPPTYDGMQESA
jgi:hypothetical protein